MPPFSLKKSVVLVGLVILLSTILFTKNLPVAVAQVSCASGNLMQQGDGVADNSLNFGSPSNGTFGMISRAFFSFIPTVNMTIDNIEVNLTNNSCFSGGRTVDIYLDQNNWVALTLVSDNWSSAVTGVLTVPLIVPVALTAGVAYEITFDWQQDASGSAGLCTIATDTNGERTASYVFPLVFFDVCGPLASCPCALSSSSAFSYYNWIPNPPGPGPTCTQVDFTATPVTCIDYDDCTVPTANSKLYSSIGFIFVTQNWKQYKDYPDIELVCAPPICTNLSCEAANAILPCDCDGYGQRGKSLVLRGK